MASATTSRHESTPARRGGRKPPSSLPPSLLTRPDNVPPTVPDLGAYDVRNLLPFDDDGRAFYEPDKFVREGANIAGLDILERIAERLIESADPTKASNRIITLADLIIRDKERGQVPFRPKPIQTDYLDTLIPDWREATRDGRPLELRGVREVILKARQLGFTTLILGLLFLDTINTPNTYTAIIADTRGKAQLLFKIVQRYHRLLPLHKKPRLEYNSRQEMSFPEIDSVFVVGAAGSGTFGRGGTVNNVHCSESAFWQDAEGIISGLLESVPASGNIFVETTANGYGGWFDETYFEAKAKKSIFTPRFYSWIEEKEYQSKVPRGFIRSPEEEILADLYRLSDEQLQWRREKILTLKTKFPQEYPITDIEAFLVTGTPYFDREPLHLLYQEMALDDEYAPLLPEIILPIVEATLREAYELRTAIEIGEVLIWKMPVAGRRYVLGADVAEGLSKDSRLDYDDADVLDADTLEQVAHVHGQWDTSDYALILSQLGYFYNTALLAVERNNHGWSVLNTLLNGRTGKTRWVYPVPSQSGGGGVYFHEDFDEHDRARRKQHTGRTRPLAATKKPGWHTNTKTKPLMLNHMVTLLDDELIALNSADTVEQLLKFVKKPGGGAGAEGTGHDDSVISLCIAAFVASQWKRGPKMRIRSLLRGGFTSNGGKRDASDTSRGMFGMGTE